ncbi:carbon monoxide dehydrogenase [filamentous cyanobacterium CCP5]|nr:carbon monoxide dehydrogenase [filamentous cyanobacterium CCP5]
MDLLNVEAVVQPRALEDVPQWQPGWAWLAGGTWLFSEPQPHLTTLVDMGHLGWSELSVTSEGIEIGATCAMAKLLGLEIPAEWPAIAALNQAVHELASFKVQGTATIVGNICLALPASTFAPVMVLLGARYQILSSSGESRWLDAADFQTGACQTQLEPGEVMRRILIPTDFLTWEVCYRRLCLASAGIAVAIAVAARNPAREQMRYAIGGGLPAPVLLELGAEEVSFGAVLDDVIPRDRWLDNVTGGADYRRAMTAVLMGQCFDALSQTP